MFAKGAAPGVRLRTQCPSSTGLASASREAATEIQPTAQAVGRSGKSRSPEGRKKVLTLITSTRGKRGDINRAIPADGPRRDTCVHRAAPTPSPQRRNQQWEV